VRVVGGVCWNTSSARRTWSALSWRRVKRYLRYGAPAGGACVCVVYAYKPTYVFTTITLAMILFEVSGFQLSTVFVAFLKDEDILAGMF
jgi:hypothetical protein